MKASDRLPDGWHEAPISEVAPLQRGFDLPARAIRAGRYPIVYSNGVGGTHHQAMVRGPGVVTGRSGTLGKIFFVHEDFWPHNTSLWVTTFHGNDPRYVAYLYNSLGFDRFASGSGVPTLNRNDAHSFLVQLPCDPKEQKTIAQTLSDIDELIASLDALIGKKRDIKQGAMQLLLTGKRRLPGFSGEWDEVTLGTLGKFLKGSGVRRDQSQSGFVPCVRYGELYTHHHEIIRHFYSKASVNVAQSATPLQRGDILFAGSGETKEEIGKCAAFIAQEYAVAGGDIIILRAKDHSPEFLGYLLNTLSIARQKAGFAQGDAVVHISGASLARIKLRLPKVEEQEAISDAILAVDADLHSLSEKVVKMRLVRQGMMQQLLTGRIRLA